MISATKGARMGVKGGIHVYVRLLTVKIDKRTREEDSRNSVVLISLHLHVGEKVPELSAGL